MYLAGAHPTQWSQDRSGNATARRANRSTRSSSAGRARRQWAAGSSRACSMWRWPSATGGGATMHGQHGQQHGQQLGQQRSRVECGACGGACGAWASGGGVTIRTGNTATRGRRMDRCGYGKASLIKRARVAQTRPLRPDAQPAAGPLMTDHWPPSICPSALLPFLPSAPSPSQVVNSRPLLAAGLPELLGCCLAAAARCPPPAPCPSVASTSPSAPCHCALHMRALPVRLLLHPRPHLHLDTTAKQHRRPSR